MRIPATSGCVRRSVVAGLCPGYRRCQPRPRCRYPSSWPSRYRPSRYRASRYRASRYRASRYRASRGTEYRASWTSTPTTPTSRKAWRWATLGHSTKTRPLSGEGPIQQFHTDEIPPRSRLDPRRVPPRLLVVVLRCSVFGGGSAQDRREVVPALPDRTRGFTPTRHDQVASGRCLPGPSVGVCTGLVGGLPGCCGGLCGGCGFLVVTVPVSLRRRGSLGGASGASCRVRQPIWSSARR